MANNNPIKVDLDRFENKIKDIREVSREIIADNTVCDEPAKFIADNPIIQDYCDFHNEILDLLKTFKKENELFTDRLSEIGENYRAMNDTATQRISADKVEHNAMPVSSKTQTGSSLNAPVSTMPKLEGGFSSSYKTGDAEVDTEIDALFEEYGEDLSGLIGCPLTVWDEFSENRKKALAQIYYTDMNLVTTQYPADAVRLNAILTMLQSTETYSTKAFDQDKLDALDRLIPKGSSNARSIIGLMKQMNQSQVAGFDGYNDISIEQTIEGIRFVLSDGLSESDIGEEIGFYKYPIDLYADYLTEDEAVNNEIKTLFLNYGEDLYGLAYEALNQPTFGCISDYWDNLSIEKRKAIARVFYIDMNRIIDERSDDVERVESILTLFQNGGDATGMAFNVDDLNELKGLIYGNGNIFMDVEKKLSYAGYDSTLDVLEKMATMPTHVGNENGRVKIEQTSESVIFSLVDNNGNEVNELGLYFDRIRSREYINNLLDENPNAFNHFKDITGMDDEDAIGYICTCVNKNDLEFMTELIKTNADYDFIQEFIRPKQISSGCIFKFTEYTDLILERSLEYQDNSEYKQEYANIINAILKNQGCEDAYRLSGEVDTEVSEALEGKRTLLNLMALYSYIDADIKNREAWVLADYQVRKELGLISNDFKDINTSEIERILAVSNMNATVWAEIKNYHDELDLKKWESCPYFTVQLVGEQRKNWNEHKIIFNSSLSKEIECVCDDYLEAEGANTTKKFSDNYDEMIREKDNIPEKILMDSLCALLNTAAPEAGVPISLLMKATTGDVKGTIGYAGKDLGLACDSIESKVIVNVSTAVVNDGIEYFNLEKKYMEKNKAEIDNFKYNFGTSKTGNGNEIVEYTNMKELLNINYSGIDKQYHLKMEEQDIFSAKKRIKSVFTDGLTANQPFSDEEIDNALLLIWYGDEASKNKVIENRDNPEEKVMWHEETEYKTIFEIPEVLCYLCLEKSDVKTKVTYMFNENVGNVPTETTDE